jgi:Family of unknown function (DUF6084)
MPDLSFRIRELAPLAYAAVPTIAARLEIANATPKQPVRSLSLNCQVQIEPLRRPYTAQEEARLLDLFGERERWARSMKPLLWTITVLKVPGFASDVSLDLPLPCTLDFDMAATKYFYGLEQGHIAVSVLFSGTIFYAVEDGSLQIEQIPWDREARFQLPLQVWQDAIRAHYPESAWLRLSKETFDRLYRFKVARGIPAFDRLIEELLDQAERTVLQDRVPAAAAEVVK